MYVKGNSFFLTYLIFLVLLFNCPVRENRAVFIDIVCEFSYFYILYSKVKTNMACSCKNKFKQMEKYSDEGVSQHNSKEKLNPFKKILQILMQLCFGIFCSVVIIIMIVPMLLYIIICLITGKEAHFELKNYLKKKNK